MTNAWIQYGNKFHLILLKGKKKYKINILEVYKSNILLDNFSILIEHLHIKSPVSLIARVIQNNYRTFDC